MKLPKIPPTNPNPNYPDPPSFREPFPNPFDPIVPDSNPDPELMILVLLLHVPLTHQLQTI